MTRNYCWISIKQLDLKDLHVDPEDSIFTVFQATYYTCHLKTECKYSLHFYFLQATAGQDNMVVGCVPCF